MSRKNDASDMVRGMGMAMAFIQILEDEIVEAGGFKEMIHFLTKKAGRPLAKKIAELIVKTKWQIPLSLVERLARKKSIAEYDTKTAEWDKRWWWARVLGDLGVPMIGFHPDIGGEPVPNAISDQLVGKPATYPMIVQWNDEPHVVVGIQAPFDDVGEVIFEAPFSIDLAPAKYFNLKQ